MSKAITARILGRPDAQAALLLYNELTVGPPTDDVDGFFRILDHPGTSVFGVWARDRLVSMVTLHLLPNVLWQGRPYALIENVVTAADMQKRGHGRQAMQDAIDAAWHADAYKIMLMTGQKRGAKGFYEALGFSSEDKFAMVLRRE